jgi:tripartite-type tricarboxylate transporter receptor subunit TctC
LEAVLDGDGRENAMTFPRRRFLHLAAGAAALPATSPIAGAQSYPARPVRFVVGFAPGGPNDILARLIGEWLSNRLGQPFVVENLPGGSSNPATEVVVRAPPDGYTILIMGPANAINASLFPNLSFEVRRDIAPVAGLTREALVLVVHPSVPASTVPELIAYAKANPGKIRLAMTGTGSSPHVSGKLFRLMTGVDMTEVYYDGGGPALRDMLAGRADMMFEPMSASIEPIRKGSLRALAVTTAGRSDALPSLPTMADALPGYEASAVTGIGVPRNTPSEIIDTLNKAINAAYVDPGMKARLAETGGTTLAVSPAEFGRIFSEEIEKWAKVVKSAGMKPQ